MMRKILIPTDCTESTFDGIRYAAAELAVEPVHCTLLHVIEHTSGPSRPAAGGTGDRIEPVELALDRLHRLIAGFKLPPTMTLEPAVRFGEPWKEVLRFAAESGTDLIVTAAVPAEGTTDSFPARIADLIARYSPVPVLMLKPGSSPGVAVPWEELREQVHITVDDDIRHHRHPNGGAESLVS
jgi:nucleotide-binding universal stress UspA family protein